VFKQVISIGVGKTKKQKKSGRSMFETTFKLLLVNASNSETSLVKAVTTVHV